MKTFNGYISDIIRTVFFVFFFNSISLVIVLYFTFKMDHREHGGFFYKINKTRGDKL